MLRRIRFPLLLCQPQPEHLETIQMYSLVDLGSEVQIQCYEAEMKAPPESLRGECISYFFELPTAIPLAQGHICLISASVFSTHICF